jgi:hypothetical protein
MTGRSKCRLLLTDRRRRFSAQSPDPTRKMGRSARSGLDVRPSGSGATRLFSNNRGHEKLQWGGFGRSPQLEPGLAGRRRRRCRRAFQASTRSPGGQSIRACSRGSSAALAKQPRSDSSRSRSSARVLSELIPLIFCAGAKRARQFVHGSVKRMADAQVEGVAAGLAVSNGTSPVAAALHNQKNVAEYRIFFSRLVE